MLKNIISGMFLLCLTFQSFAADNVNALYTSLENKNFDKPYTDFIEPLSNIIGTSEPVAPSGSGNLEFISNVTGLKFARFYQTPIIEPERKINQADFKTDDFALKASHSYVISFFTVNKKVEKILLNVQSRYGDDYYKLTNTQEVTDHHEYLHEKLIAAGWEEHSLFSFFTGKYVYTKGNVELVTRNTAFYPLEIDIKRTDLKEARDKFDDLAKLDREMLSKSVEDSRKERFKD